VIDDALSACPDGCWRPKARNASDCGAGCCSKWYAIRDPAADTECAKLAEFWRNPSDAALGRWCREQMKQMGPVKTVSGKDVYTVMLPPVARDAGLQVAIDLIIKNTAT
jgi:hypothetical protein